MIIEIILCTIASIIIGRYIANFVSTHLVCFSMAGEAFVFIWIFSSGIIFGILGWVFL